PDADVTGHVLRLPLAPIRNQAIAQLRTQEIVWGEAHAPEDEPLRRGSRGYPSSHYRHLAVRYLALVGSGRRDVDKALEAEETERLGKVVKYGTIRSQLRRAVELGYLERAPKQGL